MFKECDPDSKRQNDFAVLTAAVVVLYHPGDEVVANIRSWNDQVTKVYAVDNSEPPDESFAARMVDLGNVTWLPQRENVGVAAALNMGAELAISEGFSFLLTMDQDSRATPNMVATLLACVVEGGRDVGIIAPFQLLKSGSVPPRSGNEEAEAVLTSGNILNLRAYEIVGPFVDELFIDMVDIEYCLRLRSAGYRIIRCHDALLEHNLGDITAHRYLGRMVSVSNHPPLRRYYMSRNRFYVIARYRSQYPEFCRRQIRQIVGEIKGIILFEHEKPAKLWMTLKGYLDYHRRKMGRFHA